MRDIKFRAWRESAKRFSKPFTLLNPLLNFSDDDGLGVMKSLTDEIVVQFIENLNGTDVYTGDIVEYVECVADYHYVTQRVMAELSPNFLTLIEWNMEDHFKVIGNIHQNPELIER